jgi:hypothetical protein
MTAKPLILAVITACGVLSGAAPPAEPDRKPPDEIQEGQHFCCETLRGNGSGNGCVTIDKSHAGQCDKLLYCGGTYEKDGGKVTCID